HRSAANVGIREHRRAGLTTNARICRHAEAVIPTAFLYFQLGLFILTSLSFVPIILYENETPTLFFS
ncbi:hypothetical protein, partial [Bacillus licheniformis]|uniref:hypothetical protein n=2 Tax=Bacillus TaxID=1386 RepID=UPI0005CE7EB1